MGKFDVNQGMVFAVVETFSAQDVPIMPPEIVRMSLDFIVRLVKEETFLSLFIETKYKLLSVFPTVNQADDYYNSRISTNH